MQTVHDRIALQRGIHAFHGMPDSYESIQEKWMDNEYMAHLVAATIRSDEPDQIVGEFETIFADQPDVFPETIELGQLRIDPGGIKR